MTAVLRIGKDGSEERKYVILIMDLNMQLIAGTLDTHVPVFKFSQHLTLNGYFDEQSNNWDRYWVISCSSFFEG